jgi:hypothetical protein
MYLAARDPLHQWGLANRKSVEVGGSRIWLAPPEYVILRKLEYFREGGSEKHLADIRAMLETTDLDLAELESRIEALGLDAEWALARQGATAE